MSNGCKGSLFKSRSTCIAISCAILLVAHFFLLKHSTSPFSLKSAPIGQGAPCVFTCLSASPRARRQSTDIRRGCAGYETRGHAGHRTSICHPRTHSPPSLPSVACLADTRGTLEGRPD